MSLVAAASTLAEAQPQDWWASHSTLIVGVVGILVSGALGPWIVGRLAERRELNNDRRAFAVARRDDLRGLLDEAAVALGKAITNLRSLMAAEDRDESLPDAQKEALGSLVPLGQRLRLRLDSDHEVILRYEEACNCLLDLSKLKGSQSDWDDGATEFEEKREIFMEAGRVAVKKPIRKDGSGD